MSRSKYRCSFRTLIAAASLSALETAPVRPFFSQIRPLAPFGELSLRRGDFVLPQYFFHLLRTDRVDKDREGIMFADLQAAQDDARASLFEMMADELASGSPTTLTGIDIADSIGTVLAAIRVDNAFRD